MKIGFMANYFYPATGGMEELTFNIAKELVKRGHTVHIFTSDRKEGVIFKKEEVVDGVQIHRSKLYFSYKYYLKFNPGIAFKHLKYDLDVLHVQSLGFFFQDIGVIFRKIFTKTKLINTPHGPFMALENYPFLQKLFREIYVIFEYPVNYLYDFAVEVNPEQYKWMKKYGFKKVEFISNSIPESIFRKVKNDNKFKGKFVISYLGRVQKYKGLEQIVRVLPFLDKKVIFYVMGGEVDNESNRLKEIAKSLGVLDRVIIAGRVDEDEKLKGLDETDVFILPSEWEAFGIVLIEAMARGCALVSTKTEGGKFVVSERNGMLFDYGNIDQLKEILLKLISDKSLVERMKKNNIKEARKYSISNMISKFEELYR